MKNSDLKCKPDLPEPYCFTKRHGSTTFLVYVHSNETSGETARDKIARLIRTDAELGKVANL